MSLLASRDLSFSASAAAAIALTQNLPYNIRAHFDYFTAPRVWFCGRQLYIHTQITPSERERRGNRIYFSNSQKYIFAAAVPANYNFHSRVKNKPTEWKRKSVGRSKAFAGNYVFMKGTSQIIAYCLAGKAAQVHS
jgi:hypothetical protein